MKGENFDKIIKQKLQQLGTDASASDWKVFESMLDEDQGMDSDFDQMISEELNGLKDTYQSQHWEQLHAILELQQERNNTIIGYKIIEFSMFFLLLLSAANFGNIEERLQANRTGHIAAPAENQPLQDSDQFNSSTTEERTKYQPGISISGESIIRTKRATPAKPKKKAPIAKNEIFKAYRNHVAEPVVPVLDKSATSQQDINPEVAIEANLDAVNDIAVLEATPLAAERNIQKPIGIPLKSDVDKGHKYIAGYAALDNNLVNSPFDHIYQKSGYETYGLGLSLGANWGYVKNRWGVSMGLGYSHRSYDPRFIGETYGRSASTLYQTGLKHIDFHIMSAALGIQYLVLQRDNWNLGVHIGASSNLIAHSKYEIEDISINGFRPAPPHVQGARANILLDEKPLHAGVLQGGRLKDNFYMTVDFGLTYEQRVSNNNWLWLAPGFSMHTLSDGVGPNHDKIHNLSIKLGVKHRL